jgi:hypothetical protein
VERRAVLDEMQNVLHTIYRGRFRVCMVKYIVYTETDRSDNRVALERNTKSLKIGIQLVALRHEKGGILRGKLHQRWIILDQFGAEISHVCSKEAHGIYS